MVALEGDCTINKYTDKEGRARSDLSIVQRECSQSPDNACEEKRSDFNRID